LDFGEKLESAIRDKKNPYNQRQKSSFFKVAGVYLQIHTSFMNRRSHKITSIVDTIIIVVVIIISSVNGGGV
jgi:hypothetical protein